MEPVSRLVASLTARVVRPAPLSIGKILFAWRASVGPALARMTRVTLGPDAVLYVSVDDARWLREIERSSSTVLDRLRAMLGEDAVRRIALMAPAGSGPPARRPRTNRR